MKLKSSRRNDEPEINVTSMIDVLLLLLIFFMMATTFVDDSRLNIRLPEASAEAKSNAPRPHVQIDVSANGTYRVNGMELINTAAETLSAAVTKEAGEDREQTILIRADARTTHQSVVTAMDAVGRLGFKSISIATINQTPAAAGRQ